MQKWWKPGYLEFKKIIKMSHTSFSVFKPKSETFQKWYEWMAHIRILWRHTALELTLYFRICKETDLREVFILHLLQEWMDDWVKRWWKSKHIWNILFENGSVLSGISPVKVGRILETSGFQAHTKLQFSEKYMNMRCPSSNNSG